MPDTQPRQPDTPNQLAIKEQNMTSINCPPRLSMALAAWQAWWENNDLWDGNALYVDLETAKLHAAYDYEGEEYGHRDEDDEDDQERVYPEFTWIEQRGSWHLLDHGRDTLVQVSPSSIWRRSTEREIKQQDALTAAEEAEWAAQPRRSMAEELERLAEAAQR